VKHRVELVHCGRAVGAWARLPPASRPLVSRGGGRHRPNVSARERNSLPLPVGLVALSLLDQPAAGIRRRSVVVSITTRETPPTRTSTTSSAVPTIAKRRSGRKKRLPRPHRPRRARRRESCTPGGGVSAPQVDTSSERDESFRKHHAKNRLPPAFASASTNQSSVSRNAESHWSDPHPSGQQDQH
jgi:hypothetical protein